MKPKSIFTIVKKISNTFFLILAPFSIFAAQDQNLTTLSKAVTEQLGTVAILLSATAYVTGVGFALTGILQFKTHKENPQQVPLSKPVVSVIVAACLLFLPTLLNISGSSLFGSSAKNSATAAGVRSLDGL
jgi:intracellular multiplication protein IcmD